MGMSMKSELKNLLKRLMFHFTGPELERLHQELLNKQVFQRILSLHYQQSVKLNYPLLEFEDAGFRIYSENDEDGLLVYVFSLIGTTNKVCVEMAFGSPYGANTTNLICNWGWTGLLVEGNDNLIKQAKHFLNKILSLLQKPFIFLRFMQQRIWSIKIQMKEGTLVV